MPLVFIKRKTYIVQIFSCTCFDCCYRNSLRTANHVITLHVIIRLLVNICVHASCTLPLVQVCLYVYVDLSEIKLRNILVCPEEIFQYKCDIECCLRQVTIVTVINSDVIKCN